MSLLPIFLTLCFPFKNNTPRKRHYPAVLQQDTFTSTDMGQAVFRNWLTSLLNRPRLPENDASSAAREAVSQDGSAQSGEDQGFQPIRSQEDILQEEERERASSRRNGVISRFFDDGATQRVRSRP
ncbi:MAG: hypothetical protein AAF718_01925 [Pseudomonadota bacterium]